MEKNEYRIIFHLPWQISVNASSGSEIRPIAMLEAFRRNFAHVDVVMGSGRERFYQILEIRRKIKKGFKYNFVYSESSTYPTLLANSTLDAFLYPFLDFFFFIICKKNNIPISLFYRDIYWKFPNYIKKCFIKKYILKILYKIDLIIYKNCLNVIYLPSLEMKNYIGRIDVPIKTLPPGAPTHKLLPVEINKNNLTLLYVGGLGNHYRIHTLFRVVGKHPDITLIICCRKEEWEKNKIEYSPLIRPNIFIEHVKGDDLFSLYQKANIASCFFERSQYMNFAMPLKLFEYIGFSLPVIATKGTAVGDFVSNYDVGWAIPYEEKALVNLLNLIKNSPEIIQQKRNNILMILSQHTWDARVKQVLNDMVD